MEVDWNENTTCAEAFCFMVECANAGLPCMKIPHNSIGIINAIANFNIGIGLNYHLEEGRDLAGQYSLLVAPKPVEIPCRHIKVHVPAGIGDIAWVMMKLQSALGPNGTCDLLVSGEGPKRGREFAELYPCVKSVAYSDVGYQQIHKQSKSYVSLEPDFDNDKEIYLSANSHLELGNRIETYLPHYPARYDLHNLNHTPYKGPAHPKGSFKIGIYPSSYKTNQNWNCGTPEKWVERIYQMYGHFECTYPNRPIQFYLIGAKFDRRFAAEIIRLLHRDKFHRTTNTVGHLHISDTIQLIKDLDILVSFPSGIGIIGSMVDTPTIMMMPTHLAPMEYGWVDPKRIEDKSFIQLQLNDIDKELLNQVCYGVKYE